MFKGDDERLLERMIEACQTRPTEKLPGYGRQLVPFFPAPIDGQGQPLERQARAGNRGDTGKPEGRRSNKKKSPRKSANNTRNNFTSGTGCAESGRHPQATCRSDSKSEDRTVTRENSARAANENEPRKPARASKSAQGDSGKQRCGAQYGNKIFVKDTTFAGPGYFLSPPPEALPMPTAFLLSRAMAVSY